MEGPRCIEDSLRLELTRRTRKKRSPSLKTPSPLSPRLPAAVQGSGCGTCERNGILLGVYMALINGLLGFVFESFHK